MTRWPIHRQSGSVSLPNQARHVHSATPSKVYLHIGPSGDCWTGASLFAAKHLQPDYVKSIELPANIETEEIEQILEHDIELARKIYESMDISALLRILKPSR